MLRRLHTKQCNVSLSASGCFTSDLHVCSPSHFYGPTTAFSFFLSFFFFFFFLVKFHRVQTYFLFMSCRIKKKTSAFLIGKVCVMINLSNKRSPNIRCRYKCSLWICKTTSNCLRWFSSWIWYYLARSEACLQIQTFSLFSGLQSKKEKKNYQSAIYLLLLHFFLNFLWRLLCTGLDFRRKDKQTQPILITYVFSCSSKMGNHITS